MTSHGSTLDAGRDALRRGAWREAIDALTAVVDRAAADDPLAPEAWEGIAYAAYWEDDAPLAVEAHERAFAGYRRLGLPAEAARMALWLADDHLSFANATAVANGWIEQAERLLADVPDAPAHAWLPIYRGHYRLRIEHDVDAALALAETGLERARALGVPAAEIVALALRGLALVARGDVDEGMPQLDAASATAVAGVTDDLNSIAWAFCYQISGCDIIRDFQRARQWTERVLAFCERWGLGPTFSACRISYASVLTWQGQWRSAEEQIEKILVGRSGVPRPPAVERAAWVRLAALRLRQGRLDEAAELLRQAGEDRAAILGRASVALAQGEPEVALDLVDRALRTLTPDSRTERVDALLVRVLAGVAAGRLDRAQADVAELTETAERLGTELASGAAAHARGAVLAAKREPAAALAAFEDALAHYDRGGVPHEAARVRLELAELLMALGREATARREAAQARDDFERLGAVTDIERAEAFLRRPAPHAAPVTALSSLPLSRRELAVLRLVGRGLSNAEIASELFLSPHTVKRHIANILRKLDCPTRAAAVARATREGAL